MGWSNLAGIVKSHVPWEINEINSFNHIHFFVITAIPAFATTITVDDGEIADYDLIQGAVNNATASDTILVYPGTYIENIDNFLFKRVDFIVMDMDKTNQKRIKKIAQTLSEVSNLNETDMLILLTLMKNSKITNSELAKMLDFKDGNSAAYHTRSMQKEGLIDRYTIIPNWKRAGLPTEFIILAEAETEGQLLEIEKEHVLMADEYSSTIGEIVVTPTISGCIVLQNVYHCFGDKTMAVISGRATSDQDAAVYCKNYLVNRYPDIKISMLLNKYKTVNEFFIDRNAVAKLKELFQIPEKYESADTLEKLQVLSSED